MATVSPRTERRRARPGSVERPVNARMYRGTWLLVGLPLLVAAFSVARPQALDPGPLPATFGGHPAPSLARDLARLHPDRHPGSQGDLGAADWVADRLGAYGFSTERHPFT